jgi:hypothetical protein
LPTVSPKAVYNFSFASSVVFLPLSPAIYKIASQQKQNIKINTLSRTQDSPVKMADAKTKVESIREWVVEHKLRAVGN